MKKFTIEKSTIECYKIRSSNSSYWADIAIDHNGGSGRISISSDYGDWTNFWGAAGRDFKDFLTGLDMHYCAGKFGVDREFDPDATIEMYKKQIIELRKMDDMSAEVARSLYDNFKGLEDCSDEHIFIDRIFGFEHADGFLYDGCPETIKIVKPMFKRFWDEMWPIFIAELKKEAEEKDKILA